jgi:hypothetical protein
MEADEFGFLPFLGRGSLEHPDRLRVPFREFGFDFGEVSGALVTPANGFGRFESAFEFSPKRRRIRDEETRPDFRDGLAVGPERRHVDTVHRGAAHQADRAYRVGRLVHFSTNFRSKGVKVTFYVILADEMINPARTTSRPNDAQIFIQEFQHARP